MVGMLLAQAALLPRETEIFQVRTRSMPKVFVGRDGKGIVAVYAVTIAFCHTFLIKEGLPITIGLPFWALGRSLRRGRRHVT